MRLFLFLSLLLIPLLGQAAESQTEAQLNLLGADLGILTDSEWQLVLNAAPATVVTKPLSTSFPQVVLRRIIVEPLPDETDVDFRARVIKLADDLRTNPDGFITLAKELSPIRQSLLSPMTLNQFEEKELKALAHLEPGEVSLPIPGLRDFSIYRMVSR